MTFQDLSYIGALFVAAIAVYKGFIEGKKTHAETYETYERTVQMIQRRLDDLDEELNDWKDWAERLVEQVKHLGGKPVPFVSHKKKEKE